ncbi:MAG: hypothetical protein CMF46_04630 [Legionellales bacterium]|nr:hypothetical protein [Legionellales bacterium]|tara:strand:- start:2555 stop:2944 length:390 start_codon:yes stop_codon:yes gene_type:complete
MASRIEQSDAEEIVQPDAKRIVRSDIVRLVFKMMAGRMELEEVKNSLDVFTKIVGHSLSTGERIEMRNFGILYKRILGAKNSHCPRTLQRKRTKGGVTIRFKMGKSLRESLKQLGESEHRKEDDVSIVE